ncbi:uncharacterized protein LOC144103815 isoform X2 [Amblyomma americanum]
MEVVLLCLSLAVFCSFSECGLPPEAMPSGGAVTHLRVLDPLLEHVCLSALKDEDATEHHAAIPALAVYT